MASLVIKQAADLRSAIRSVGGGALFGWGQLLPTASGTVDVVPRSEYPPSMIEFLIGRIEIYGRGFDGPLTDAQVAQWYRDMHGLRWCLCHNGRSCVDVVHLPLPGDSTLCRWAQNAPDIAMVHSAWDVARAFEGPTKPGTPWLGTPLDPKKVSTATLVYPIQLVAADGPWSLTATLPPGWRGSQPWQVGCALLGIRVDKLSA